MKNDAKQLAKRAYMEGGMTLTEIHKSVNVSAKTLRQWIEKEGWERQRLLKRVTPTQLLEDTYAQLAAVNKQIMDRDGVPTKLEYDAKSILGKEIERLTQTSVADRVDTMEVFLLWLAKNSPQHLQLFSDLSTRFINTLK